MVFTIIGLFIGAGVFPIIGSNVSFYDRLDQKQTYGRIGWFLSSDFRPSLAQSFKPTLDNLSRVQIKINRQWEHLVDGILNLSIRSSLDGDELTKKSITEGEIIIAELPEWHEFDFPDIDVIPEETYYIVCHWEGTKNGPNWGDSPIDNYSRGAQWIYLLGVGWWERDQQDFAFKTYGYNSSDPKPIPDLDCIGSLGWTNIESGATVIDKFKILNVGERGSKLNWEVESFPDWGNWTFTPENGSGLTPEDGKVTVQVSVVAPDEKEQNFTGEIKVVNMENASDYETIAVSLSTPKNKPINTPLLTFLENHPNLFPLLRQILGL